LDAVTILQTASFWCTFVTLSTTVLSCDRFLQLLNLVSREILVAEDFVNMTSPLFKGTEIPTQLRRLFRLPLRYAQGRPTYPQRMPHFQSDNGKLGAVEPGLCCLGERAIANELADTYAEHGLRWLLGWITSTYDLTAVHTPVPTSLSSHILILVFHDRTKGSVSSGHQKLYKGDEIEKIRCVFDPNWFVRRSIEWRVYVPEYRKWRQSHTKHIRRRMEWGRTQDYNVGCLLWAKRFRYQCVSPFRNSNQSQMHWIEGEVRFQRAQQDYLCSHGW